MKKPFDRVMVIDDCETDLFITTRILTISNFTHAIISYNSVRAALKHFEEQHDEACKLPEFIFLDLNMPEFSGFDFLNAFDLFPQPRRQKCKIIVLSSSNNPLDIQRAGQHPHVIRFVTKPLSEDVLSELQEFHSSSC